MTTTMQYFDLLELLQSADGCAVCHLLKRSIKRYIDALLYEYINKTQTHQAIRASRGLCNQHQWDLQAGQGHSLQVAILCRTALDEVLTITQEGQNNGTSFKRLLGRASLADALEPTNQCMVCEYMNDTETVLLKMVADNINDSRFLEAYEDSGGFCLAHVKGLMREVKSGDKASQFITLQRRIWQALHDELDLLIRKNDVEYADQVIGEEGDSWRRAIRYLSGEQGIFGLRR